jgi:hypothetical protein
MFTVSILSQTWALDMFSPKQKHIYEETKQKLIVYVFKTDENSNFSK